MANPVKELQRILGARPQKGVCTVVSTNGLTATVSGAVGTIMVQVAGVQVNVGDQVLVDNGSLIGKVRNQSELAVYHL